MIEHAKSAVRPIRGRGKMDPPVHVSSVYGAHAHRIRDMYMWVKSHTRSTYVDGSLGSISRVCDW